jgi:hypothetical protein
MEALGIVQTTFTVTGNFRYRSVINNQAYMHLLMEGQKKYDGFIDIRDVTWTLEKGDPANNRYQYFAIGTVVRK